MKHGHINKTNEINLDLSGVQAILDKQAGDVGLQSAQDTAKDYSGDSTIGDEDKFTADKPTAPHGTATMGDESSDLQKDDKASVPTGQALMGDEGQDLKPELDDKATGGEEGAGNAKAASTKDRVNTLADSVLRNLKKAEEKVVRKQVQDDEDTKPYSGDSFMGHEKESIGDIPAAKTTPDGTPEDQQFLGKEKESIGDKPDAVKMTPDIPTSDDRIGGETDNDKIAPEKENEMTGNIEGGTFGSSENESKVYKEAFRIAGRMLQENMIEANGLETKVKELSAYKLNQLGDLEKGMFNAKGLDVPSGGSEQAVLVSEASTEKDTLERHANQSDDLVSKLQSMFSLTQRVEAAQSDDITELRKVYGR